MAALRICLLRRAGSEVAWLWTALLPWKLHPPSLPSPSSQSHWGEQRNRGDRGGRENWPGHTAPPSLPSPPSSQHPTQDAPTAQPAPGLWRGSLTPQPPTPWRPRHSLLAGGAELTETSLTAQPQVTLTHAGPVNIQTQGLEEGKGTNFQPSPQARVGLRNVPRPLCPLSSSECSGVGDGGCGTGLAIALSLRDRAEDEAFPSPPQGRGAAQQEPCPGGMPTSWWPQDNQ